MINNNYAGQIARNLEAKGESKDFIIGFLTQTLNGMRHFLDTHEVEKYLKRTVEQTRDLWKLSCLF